jgi:hypothetical protein
MEVSDGLGGKPRGVDSHEATKRRRALQVGDDRWCLSSDDACDGIGDKTKNQRDSIKHGQIVPDYGLV